MIDPYLAVKLITIFAGGLAIGLLFPTAYITIREYERGLLFKRGKFIKQLTRGRYYLGRSKVITIDMRPENYMVHQNILTSDNIHVGININVRTRVSDAYKAFTSSQNFQQDAHDISRSVIKEIGKSTTTKTVIKEDEKFEKKLETPLKKQLENIGMELVSIELIDANLPHSIQESIADSIDLAKKKPKAKKVGF